MSKYEVLIFDADETLIDYTRGQAYALEDHIDLYQRINDKLWKELEEGAIDRETLKNSRFKLVLDELGIVNADPAAMSADYLIQLGDAGFMIEGAETLLESLHKHFKLALLTNGFSQVQRSRISRTNTARFFTPSLSPRKWDARSPRERSLTCFLTGSVTTTEKASL